jgi:cell division transport system permease protein
MAETFKKKLRRRVSYIPTFFSISLVLFLTGLFGLFILNANALKQSIKEDVQLSLYFKDNVNEADIMRIKTKLETEPYVKSAIYISKDQALKKWEKDNGDNPDSLLGFNPFPNSVDVHFKAGFVALDSLNKLKTTLEKNPIVREVNYNKVVVDNIDRYVGMAGIILISLALIMAIVSIMLIYSAIRLTMYSRRFLIKSMQLVGATKNFIRKPFIARGITVGLSGGIFACLLITGGLYLLVKKFPFFAVLQDYSQLSILLLFILILGVCISGLSSYFAINKYLKLKLDDLY